MSKAHHYRLWQRLVTIALLMVSIVPFVICHMAAMGETDEDRLPWRHRGGRETVMMMLRPGLVQHESGWIEDDGMDRYLEEVTWTKKENNYARDGHNLIDCSGRVFPLGTICYRLAIVVLRRPTCPQCPFSATQMPHHPLHKPNGKTDLTVTKLHCWLVDSSLVDPRWVGQHHSRIAAQIFIGIAQI